MEFFNGIQELRTPILPLKIERLHLTLCRQGEAIVAMRSISYDHERNCDANPWLPLAEARYERHH